MNYNVSLEDIIVDLSCEKRQTTITWFGPSLDSIEKLDVNIKNQFNQMISQLPTCTNPYEASLKIPGVAVTVSVRVWAN